MTLTTLVGCFAGCAAAVGFSVFTAFEITFGTTFAVLNEPKLPTALSDCSALDFAGCFSVASHPCAVPLILFDSELLPDAAAVGVESKPLPDLITVMVTPLHGFPGLDGGDTSSLEMTGESTAAAGDLEATDDFTTAEGFVAGVLEAIGDFGATRDFNCEVFGVAKQTYQCKFI